MRRLAGLAAVVAQLIVRERRCRAHIEANGTYPPACGSCGRRV